MKFLKCAAAALLCALMLPAFVSCDSLVKITYKDGKYIDKANDIVYLGAPVSYEPVKVGAEYAKYDKTVLYEIPGLEPTEWLTESYDGIGSVYYADGLTLPALNEFEAYKIYICVEEMITMQIGEVADESTVAQAVEAFSGESVELPQNGLNNYHFKFVSKTYPALFYDVLYIEVDDEHNYLYDRATKQCVDVGRMFKEYLPSDADMEADALETADTGTQL